MVRIALGVIVALVVLALWGRWVENNMYVTHNPTVAIGEYISQTGQWPKSWDDVAGVGLSLPSTVRHVEVAWQIDPYELLAKGKIIGEGVSSSKSYCSVVYRPRDKPDVTEIDWHLHPILAEALSAAKRTEQAEALKP